MKVFRVGIRCWAVALVAISVGASGCPATGDQPLALTAGRQAPVQVRPEPPPQLLAHVRVGSVPQAVTDLTAAGRQLGLTNVRGDELWPLLRQLLGAATDLAELVDWRRPVHLLVLDPAKHRVPIAALLPTRQPARALGRLAHRCQAHRQRALWIFTGGGQALLPCRFAARSLDGGILVAPDAATLKHLWRFALRTAQQDRAGGPTLEARIFAGALLGKLGFNTQKLDQLAKVGALGLSLAGGDLDDAPRLEAALTRLFSYLRSARDVGLQLRLGGAEIQLRLFATATPRGALRRYIERQRPTQLPDLRPLPRRAPVSLALAGTLGPPPKSAAAPGLLLTTVLSRLPAPLRKPLGRLISRFSAQRRGLSLAFEPRPAGGLCLVARVHSAQPERLVTAVQKDVTRIVQALATQRPKGSSGVQPVARPSSRSGVRAVDIGLGGTWPKANRSAQLVLQWLAGGEQLRLATAHTDRQVVLALGAGAEQIASRRVRRNRPAQAHAGPVLPGGRFGQVRLSLIELARAVPLLGAGLKLPSRAPGALTLHWGVRPLALEVDATLHLPLAHLKASAPLWRWLFDRLAAQGRALSSLTPRVGTEPDDDL